MMRFYSFPHLRDKVTKVTVVELVQGHAGHRKWSWDLNSGVWCWSWLIQPLYKVFKTLTCHLEQLSQHF